ncbi:MAG: hypothetical protein QOE16_2684, partial [Microbacteriaceae bacterium]|nr:hypothetical protein [Microbacteriaceae bacterium]
LVGFHQRAESALGLQHVAGSVDEFGQGPIEFAAGSIGEGDGVVVIHVRHLDRLLVLVTVASAP